ncbi:ODC1, partial [Cordylochernes scorpioides]
MKTNNNELQMNGVEVGDRPLMEVVREAALRPDQDESFFVVDLADIVLKHKLWKLKLPRVAPFYAVKCNDCPVVLEFLAALGVNFDCASKVSGGCNGLLLGETGGLLPPRGLVAESQGVKVLAAVFFREYVAEGRMVPPVGRVSSHYLQTWVAEDTKKPHDCNPTMAGSVSLGWVQSEIQAVLSAGVDPSRIIYANPCKTRSFIKYAAAVGVDLMTFDNEVELHKIKGVHPGARLILRIRVDDSHSHFRLGLKFGCEVEEAERLLATAQDLGLAVVGVSFHVGSGCREASAFTQAVADARHVFDVARHRLGMELSVLDIGGGFPGKAEPHVGQFEEMADAVNTALELWFPEESGVQVIAEPGRYYVTSAFTLATNIIAKRESAMDGTTMYYLNDGVYGSFNCVIYEPTALHPIPLTVDGGNVEEREILRSSLWGPTCDSLDRVMEETFLPNMEVGEWLVFHNMGAYSLTSATTFNGFPKSAALRFVLPTHI